MPTLRDPIADERFADVVTRLRAARPVAPEALRERVRASALAPAPAPRRFRPARVLVPAVALVLVATLGAAGRALQDGGRDQELVGALSSAGDAGESGEAAVRAAPGPGGAFAPVPPPGRLQEQRIELGVRVADVDALADATAHAMRIARALGGYVVAAHYAVPSPEGGDSTLVVRVPSGRVQEAIERLTGLGTIASQDVQLQDLQPAFDRRARELRSLRDRIERLEQQLAAPGVGEQERARLRAQLAAARRAVETREAQQRATEQQGRLARVALTLTTRGPAAAEEPGEAAATLRAALGLLQRLLVWLLAGLIVASPLLALAALAAAAVHGRRRLLQARLLERS